MENLFIIFKVRLGCSTAGYKGGRGLRLEQDRGPSATKTGKGAESCS